VLDAIEVRGGIQRTIAKLIRQELAEDSSPAPESLGTGIDGAVREIEAELTKWMCASTTHASMGGVCGSCAHRLALIAKLHALRGDVDAAHRDTAEVRDDLIAAYEVLAAIVTTLGLPPETDGPALLAAVQNESQLATQWRLDWKAARATRDALRAERDALRTESADARKRLDEVSAKLDHTERAYKKLSLERDDFEAQVAYLVAQRDSLSKQLDHAREQHEEHFRELRAALRCPDETMLIEWAREFANAGAKGGERLANTEASLARLACIIAERGALTEGQLVRVLGIDRLDVRRLIDDGGPLLDGAGVNPAWRAAR
jgi:hypothetical protein